MHKIIKISIEFIIGVIIFFILSLFGIYLLLAISGINLENLNIKNIHIGKLYIKIDKKLIINANNIKILPKKDNKNTKINYSKINKIIKDNFLYLNYLQKVSLNNIEIDKTKITYLKFFNNQLETDTNFLYLNASFFPQNKKIDFIIHKIIYKPLNITLKNIEGYEKADLFTLKLFAKYQYQNNLVKLNLKVRNNIEYIVNIKNLNDKLISKFYPLLKDNNIQISNLTIKGDKKFANFKANNIDIKYNDYNVSAKIINLNGSYNIKNNKFFINSNNILIKQKNESLKLAKININGAINDFIFKIKNLLLNSDNYKLIVEIPFITGKYKNNELQLNSHKIFLTQLDINNSKKLSINNSFISLKNNKLYINIYTKEILSPAIIHLLKKFNLPIPVYQATGKNNLIINLIYNLKNQKIDTYIKAKIFDSKLMITKNDFLTIKKANLELNNSIITIKNSALNYKKSIVDLNYAVKKATINIEKNFIKTDGKIKDLKLENIGEIKEFNESAYIDLNKLAIHLKNLKTDILIGDKITININKLSILYPYVSYLKEYQLLDGNITIKIKDKINIKTNITKTNQQILEKNGIPLNKITLTTTIDKNKIKIKNSNFRIDILNKNPMKIDGGIKNIDINITKFVNEALEKNKTNSNQEYIVNLEGLNTNIIYKTYKLYSYKLSLHYDKNFTKIESLYNDRNITLVSKNNILKIYGFNLREKELKELANIKFIKDAKINFFALETNQSTALQGFIQINRGYIKELKAFNNIIAFINLIPSLVTFNGPGFSQKGFKIRDGHIDYIYNNGILYIKKGYLKGDNLKFRFQGYIDLVKKTINMNVDAIIIVKLIKDIPIVNYIILGKDKGITIKLKVSGKLNNPKVEKNLAKGVIEAPFGIIKRTLLTPFKLFIKE